MNEVGVKFTDDLGKVMEKGGGKAAAGMGEGADSFNILGGLAQWASAITSEKEKKVDWASAGLDLVEGVPADDLHETADVLPALMPVDLGRATNVEVGVLLEDQLLQDEELCTR